MSYSTNELTFAPFIALEKTKYSTCISKTELKENVETWDGSLNLNHLAKHFVL